MFRQILVETNQLIYSLKCSSTLYNLCCHGNKDDRNETLLRFQNSIHKSV